MPEALAGVRLMEINGDLDRKLLTLSKLSDAEIHGATIILAAAAYNPIYSRHVENGKQTLMKVAQFFTDEQHRRIVRRNS